MIEHYIDRDAPQMQRIAMDTFLTRDLPLERSYGWFSASGMECSRKKRSISLLASGP